MFSETCVCAKYNEANDEMRVSTKVIISEICVLRLENNYRLRQRKVFLKVSHFSKFFVIRFQLLRRAGIRMNLFKPLQMKSHTFRCSRMRSQVSGQLRNNIFGICVEHFQTLLHDFQPKNIYCQVCFATFFSKSFPSRIGMLE